MVEMIETVPRRACGLRWRHFRPAGSWEEVRRRDQRPTGQFLTIGRRRAWNVASATRIDLDPLLGKV